MRDTRLTIHFNDSSMEDVAEALTVAIKQLEGRRSESQAAIQQRVQRWRQMLDIIHRKQLEI